ncbi:ribonuclease J [Halomonas sp.]|uniref:ribonuclease J n=1 Tax=Halomonas sp. TaxID=1486246 RepID=UPI0035657DAA
MNLTLYGVDQDWIAVDCGMMIRQDLPDTPLQVPNTDCLTTLAITPRGLIITHGHEDHIGATAWLWPKWGCPIHATPLAAGLLRAKFAERGLNSDAIRVIEPGEAMETGPFTLRFLAVTHSMPESCSLLITAGGHRVLHTGDWKLDADPLIGPPIDAATFRAIAPVDLVTGDSTNAPLPGHSRSEGDVADALIDAISRCESRVVVSCFASNLARVLAIARAARHSGRRVSLMGRSMERMLAIARGLGYLDDFPSLVPVNDLGYLPPEEVLVIATGSQGEPRAALSRLAHGRHPSFEMRPGDSVIFSAKAIPGNEHLIDRLKASLKRLGVTLLDEFNHPELHASGHPAQEELRTFYEWVKPRHLLPVHGEPRHQQAHRELAERLGIQAPLLPVDGDMIRLDTDGLHLESRRAQPPCIVKRDAISPLPGLGNDRGHRSRHGSLYLALSVTITEEGGWTRIGRLMLDTSQCSPLDEDAFSDWLDHELQGLSADTLADLRLAMQPRMLTWFADHLHRVPEIHLQILAVESPSTSEVEQ